MAFYDITGELMTLRTIQINYYASVNIDTL